jgi:hypothetical protein
VARSPQNTASRSSRPKPGTTKICSVTTAPPRSAPSWSPKIVMTGISPSRIAWRKTTMPVRSLFAYAVRM